MRREFPKKVRVKAFERSGGFCEGCGSRLVPGKYDYDHVLPAALGGEPTLENCSVKCDPCHGVKTVEDVRRIRKADRQKAAHIGARPKPKRPMPGSKHSKWKRKMDGSVVPR